MSGSYYDYTKKRLAELHDFSSETLEWVAKRAQWQQSHKSYRDLFEAIGVPGVQTFVAENGDGVPYVDVPARKKPQAGVLVVHTTMGNPLDANQLYQIAVIADTNPAYRVVGFGNPSGKPFYVAEQSLSFAKWWKIAFTKDARPLFHAELAYLKKQGINDFVQIGYSYGALKAVLESQYTPKGSIKKLILIDPVSHPRNPIRLAKDFSRTYQPLGEYVNRVESATYHAARGDAAKIRDYFGTLIRPVNIAIGLLLARSSISKQLGITLGRNPGASAFVAWGSKSELTSHGDFGAELRNTLGPKASRLKTITLEGEKHAFANDLYVHAALIRDALM